MVRKLLLAAMLLGLSYAPVLAQINPKSPAQTCVPLNAIKESSTIMEQRHIIRGLNQRKELIIITASPFTEKWTAWQSVQGQYLCIVAFGTVFTIVNPNGSEQ